MPAPKDESGKKYGKLTVIQKSELQHGKGVLWMCQCDCGNSIDVLGRDLRAGKLTHCGCSTAPDETGHVYGRLTVLRRHILEKPGRAMWECVCTCGNLVIVAGTGLRRGETKSCGCLYSDTRKTAGMAGAMANKHSICKTWDSIGRNDRLAFLEDDDD